MPACAHSAKCRFIARVGVHSTCCRVLGISHSTAVSSCNAVTQSKCTSFRCCKFRCLRWLHDSFKIPSCENEYLLHHEMNFNVRWAQGWVISRTEEAVHCQKCRNVLGHQEYVSKLPRTIWTLAMYAELKIWPQRCDNQTFFPSKKNLKRTERT